MNRFVSLRSGRSADHVFSSNRSALARERETRPRSSSARKKLVRALDFFAGELFCDVQGKADQRER
jgi:hypothetical protein